MLPGTLSLFAVHISDGVLRDTWLLGGFAVAGALLVAAAWRVRDEEIPQIALLTTAFFVASSIHIKVGPSSWHLLLNGLAGVILGRRAALAIFVGLLLQCLLLGHGGVSALGVNTCVMVLPALLGYSMFATLRRVPWVRRVWFRAVLVGLSVVLWTLSLVYSVALIASNHLRTEPMPDLDPANAITFQPLTLIGALLLAACAVWLERRLKPAPEFALGLLVGELTVLATIILNCLVLLLGGETDWTLTALALLVLHMPVAVVEGIVVGFLMGFLARVKPELLGWTRPPRPAPGAESNGRPAHAHFNGAVSPPLAGGPAPAAGRDLTGTGTRVGDQVPGVAGPASEDRGEVRHR